MQKPHVLQWLALGGLQILQVEQYLSQNDLLSTTGHTKPMPLSGFQPHKPCLSHVCTQDMLQ